MVDGDLEGTIECVAGEGENHYFNTIIQDKDSDGFVLVVTAFGSKRFKQTLVEALKQFDFDEDNTINVQDIRGNNVLKPGYEAAEAKEEPEGTQKN